jgi:hypothetical protein
VMWKETLRAQTGSWAPASRKRPMRRNLA